jgi:hypothetical protein
MEPTATTILLSLGIVGMYSDNLTVGASQERAVIINVLVYFA